MSRPLLVCVSSRSLLDARSGQNTDNRVGLRPGPGRRQPAGHHHTITHGHALPSGICGGFAGGRARCSEPLISTRTATITHGHALLPLPASSEGHHARPPSHTAMRCSRLPAVGRCGGVADDGHTITRTATITHGLALLAFGIWGGLQPKKLGGGGEITEEECPSDFSAISCFYSTLKSLSC